MLLSSYSRSRAGRRDGYSSPQNQSLSLSEAAATSGTTATSHYSSSHSPQGSFGGSRQGAEVQAAHTNSIDLPRANPSQVYSSPQRYAPPRKTISHNGSRRTDGSSNLTGGAVAEPPFRRERVLASSSWATAPPVSKNLAEEQQPATVRVVCSPHVNTDTTSQTAIDAAKMCRPSHVVAMLRPTVLGATASGIRAQSADGRRASAVRGKATPRGLVGGFTTANSLHSSPIKVLSPEGKRSDTFDERMELTNVVRNIVLDLEMGEAHVESESKAEGTSNSPTRTTQQQPLAPLHPFGSMYVSCDISRAASPSMVQQRQPHAVREDGSAFPSLVMESDLRDEHAPLAGAVSEGASATQHHFVPKIHKNLLRPTPASPFSPRRGHSARVTAVGAPRDGNGAHSNVAPARQLTYHQLQNERQPLALAAPTKPHDHSQSSGRSSAVASFLATRKTKAASEVPLASVRETARYTSGRSAAATTAPLEVLADDMAGVSSRIASILHRHKQRQLSRENSRRELHSGDSHTTEASKQVGEHAEEVADLRLAPTAPPSTQLTAEDATASNVVPVLIPHIDVGAAVCQLPASTRSLKDEDEGPQAFSQKSGPQATSSPTDSASPPQSPRALLRHENDAKEVCDILLKSICIVIPLYPEHQYCRLVVLGVRSD